MAIKIIFGNKVIEEPGAYSRQTSGIVNQAQSLPYGNVLMIDTGKGANYSGGAGVIQTTPSIVRDTSPVYQYEDSFGLKNHFVGGDLYSVADPLFNPARAGVDGAPSVTVIKAASTDPAKLDLNFTSGGAITLYTKDEGVGANGTLKKSLGTGTITTTLAATSVVGVGTSFDTELSVGDFLYEGEVLIGKIQTITDATNIVLEANAAVAVTGGAFNYADSALPFSLRNGYAVKITAGTVDTAKFVVSFYKGTYTGVYSGDGIEWNEISEADAPVQLVATSSEIATVDEFISWANENYEFNQNFWISTTTSGALDLDTTGLQLLSEGTENYNAVGALQGVLDLINDLDISIILLDDFGDDAYSANNVVISNWVGSDSRFAQRVYVGGQASRVKFNNGAGSSVDTANKYDSAIVSVVHGGNKKSSKKVVGGFRNFTAFQKAAYVVGRRAGLAPQIPCTFKALALEGEVHEMTEKERKIALDNGVLHTFYNKDVRNFTINQDINSLLANNNLVNTDGTSYENSVEYIKTQLNKEIVLNARRDLLVDEEGVVLTSLTPADVKAWLKGYLTTKEGNLIVRYQNVAVTREAGSDAYKATYEYIPNFPINKLLFTGVIIDQNLTA